MARAADFMLDAVDDLAAVWIDDVLEAELMIANALGRAGVLVRSRTCEKLEKVPEVLV